MTNVTFVIFCQRRIVSIRLFTTNDRTHVAAGVPWPRKGEGARQRRHRAHLHVLINVALWPLHVDQPQCDQICAKFCHFGKILVPIWPFLEGLLNM